MHTYLDDTTIRSGDRVYIAEDRPQGFSQEDIFTVVALNDPRYHPGKVVGLQADSASPFLHDCDGAAAPNTGWWTRPEHLAKASD